MRATTNLLLICAALAIPAAALAAEPYAGINFVRASYDEDGFGTAKPTAVALRLGTEINPNLAVEARLATGLSDDTVSGIDVEIDNFYGAYVRGMLPVGTVTPYGLIGWTKGKATASLGSFSVSESESDISYAVGVDVWLTKQTALNAEFGRLLKGDGYEIDALSVGVAFKF